MYERMRKKEETNPEFPPLENGPAESLS